MGVERILSEMTEEQRQRAYVLMEAIRSKPAGQEPLAPKTVPVRIAVAVNKDGSWTSGGDSSSSEAEAILAADPLAGERIVWVTANVPLPDETEVRGEVDG